jgi:hypothetical protein
MVAMAGGVLGLLAVFARRDALAELSGPRVLGLSRIVSLATAG